MIRTTLVRASHAYKPMMRFPDRKAPKESHEPKPHPDAPKEVADNFDHYKKLHDSGPHFNPEKLEQSGAVDLGPVSGDEKSTVFDLPPRFWNTPSLRWSPMEVDAINGGSSTSYYTPASAKAPIGVTRSRTLLFLSVRDSLAPGNVASAPLLGDDAPPTKGERVYFDATGELRSRSDGVALSMPETNKLPPQWVDASEEVDALLESMTPKLAELDRLHAKHLLPSFVDKTDQEKQIESLTAEITADFRRASQHIARLASQTTQAIRTRSLHAHEITAARNAQTALATRVQQMSSLFRRKQSLYLRRLQGMEVQDAEKKAVSDPQASGLLSSELAVQEDMELVRGVLTQSHKLQNQGGLQSTMLLDAQDTDDLAAIQERDREITQIAKSIGELAQLFQDLSAMVIEQGTMLDRIDYNIDAMATDMQHSSVQLTQAMHYQAGSGRRQLMLLLILCIALLAALLIIRPFFR
ncbi:t-SNARE affecting a late Golgi compartment protein 2 [Malassezia obtusa]|uniref:t-SNARE affecting a late Golgi compartment protein 2 n=1 Tax=Malassezia obtusa TaxID=76774 RepID=A0AAF0E026_9BASI|nr:t-SNARE affecting a late Golgi compartment protein 2 [Malassezia obtusa]